MLFTGNQPPCRLGIIRHQSRFLATWHVKGNFWCAHTLPRLLQEKQLCVQLGDCSYNSVIMWHIWMVALPKALLQGEEVLLAAGGEPCPMSCGGTGWCTSTIHHLKPEWSASTVLHPGASATLPENIAARIPHTRVQECKGTWNLQVETQQNGITAFGNVYFHVQNLLYTSKTVNVTCTSLNI